MQHRVVAGLNLAPGLAMLMVSQAHAWGWGWDFYAFTLWGLGVAAAQFFMGGAFTVRELRGSRSAGATALLVGGWLGGLAATLGAITYAITTARGC